MSSTAKSTTAPFPYPLCALITIVAYAIHSRRRRGMRSPRDNDDNDSILCLLLMWLLAVVSQNDVLPAVLGLVWCGLWANGGDAPTTTRTMVPLACAVGILGVLAYDTLFRMDI